MSVKVKEAWREKRPTAARVRCDAPGCGWQNAVPFDEVPEWVGRMCPKCGRCEVVPKADLGAWRRVLGAMCREENANEAPVGPIARRVGRER